MHTGRFTNVDRPFLLDLGGNKVDELPEKIGDYFCSMPPIALIIKHKVKPGQRDHVRAVWEKHMAPAIAANPGHTAYTYCYDDNDPDAILAFQQYTSIEASRQFLTTDSYAAYLKDVEPLLSVPAEVITLTPVWSKDDQTKE